MDNIQIIINSVRSSIFSFFSTIKFYYKQHFHFVFFLFDALFFSTHKNFHAKLSYLLPEMSIYTEKYYPKRPHEPFHSEITFKLFANFLEGKIVVYRTFHCKYIFYTKKDTKYVWGHNIIHKNTYTCKALLIFFTFTFIVSKLFFVHLTLYL